MERRRLVIVVEVGEAGASVRARRVVRVVAAVPARQAESGAHQKEHGCVQLLAQALEMSAALPGAHVNLLSWPPAGSPGVFAGTAVLLWRCRGAATEGMPSSSASSMMTATLWRRPRVALHPMKSGRSRRAIKAKPHGLQIAKGVTDCKARSKSEELSTCRPRRVWWLDA